MMYGMDLFSSHGGVRALRCRDDEAFFLQDGMPSCRSKTGKTAAVMRRGSKIS